MWQTYPGKCVWMIKGVGIERLVWPRSTFYHFICHLVFGINKHLLLLPAVVRQELVFIGHKIVAIDETPVFSGLFLFKFNFELLIFGKNHKNFINWS